MIGRGGGDVEAGSTKRSSKSRFVSGREEAEIVSAGVSKSANKIAWKEAAALRMLPSSSKSRELGAGGSTKSRRAWTD